MPRLPFHAALSDLPTEAQLDGAFSRTAVVGDNVLVQAMFEEELHALDIFAPIPPAKLSLALHQIAKESESTE